MCTVCIKGLYCIMGTMCIVSSPMSHTLLCIEECVVHVYWGPAGSSLSDEILK